MGKKSGWEQSAGMVASLSGLLEKMPEAEKVFLNARNLS